MSRLTSKPVPFSDNEQDLLDWINSLGKPFATYVKDLIRKDMNNQSNRDELKSIFKEVLKEINITSLTPSIPETSSVNSKKKNAIKGILNNLPK